jgi:hypothetical protein
VSESRTVLIVEDEFAIAELLEMVLTDEGYRVLTAANGRQGLQRLAEGPHPDLVHLRLHDADPRRRRDAPGDAGDRAAARYPLHRHELDFRGDCAGAHQELRFLRPQAVPARRHDRAGCNYFRSPKARTLRPARQQTRSLKCSFGLVAT